MVTHSSVWGVTLVMEGWSGGEARPAGAYNLIQKKRAEFMDWDKNCYIFDVTDLLS